jgi:hypothetical protein
MLVEATWLSVWIHLHLVVFIDQEVTVSYELHCFEEYPVLKQYGDNDEHK